MKILTVIIGVSLTLLLVTAAARSEPLTDDPGYVNFDSLAGIYGEPRVMINLGGSLLKFVGAMEHGDPKTGEIMRNLRSVRVNVYDTAGDSEPAESRMKEIKSALQSQQWEPIVQVREDGERVDIFVKPNGERIHGLTVMAVDGQEAVFINILGDIDPARLGEVVRHLDVDVDVHLDDPT
jgi:hypothetical protein